MGKSENAAAMPEPIRRVTVGGWSAQLLPRQSYQVRYTADRPILGFAFDRQEGVHAYASDRVRPFRARANALAYVPKGCDVFSRSPFGGEYLVVAGFSLEGGHDFAFNDRIDSLAVAAAHDIRRLFLNSASAEPLHFEARMIALLDRLRRQMGRRAPSSGAAQWMTARRLERIDEIVEAGLAGELTVQALAEELGLSPGFFSRAFRQATGRSPHAYILDRRVARARALIATGTKDLTTVALATGFSSHAHLSTTFRQKLGISPSALRASLACACVPPAS